MHARLRTMSAAALLLAGVVRLRARSDEPASSAA